MKVYHGSDTIIESPRIIVPTRPLDFGCGFYTTISYEQASRWSIIVSERNKSASRYVNTYELNLDEAERELTILKFHEPTGEWLDFICNNRLGRDSGDYDIAIGPVADDKVYRVVINYENGEYDKDYAIKRLKTELLSDQLLLHTSKSLRYLTFLKAEEVVG